MEKLVLDADSEGQIGEFFFRLHDGRFRQICPLVVADSSAASPNSGQGQFQSSAAATFEASHDFPRVSESCDVTLSRPSG